MKLNKFLSAIMLVATLAFMVACGEDPTPNPGPGPNPGPDPGPNPTDTVASTPKTVQEVIAIAEALEAGAESSDYYKVTGIVSAVQTAADKLTEYGNINFTLQDETGAISCYYINYLNNAKFTSPDQILNVGDTVAVVGKAKNYVNKNTGKSTPELANGYLAELKRNTHVMEVIDASFADVLAVRDGLAQGATSIDAYRFTGVVSAVKTAKDKLVGYGNCNFNVTDPTGASSEEIICYYTNWLDNQPFTNADDIPAIGDTVVVVGPIQNYNGSAELYKGFIESITRKAFEPIVIDDDSNLDVPAGTITCAEAIAIGKQLADKTASEEIYYIKGIVTRNDTYENTIKQYGNMNFFMVDDLNDTEEFEAYQVFGPDSVKFAALEQIQPGNVVVLRAKIYRYGDQIETEGKGKWYVYSSTNTFVPDTTGTNPPVNPGEVSYSVTFSGAMPAGWSYIPSNYTPYWYSAGGLKLSSENSGIQSPAFPASSSATVSFTVALNKNTKTGTNGTTGPNFQIIGLNESGTAVNSQDVVVNAQGTYSATVSGEGIVAIQAIMVSYPYNGTEYCNVNMSAISVEFSAN